MMEKARRLLSVMVTEAQTSLCSLREGDPANNNNNKGLDVIYVDAMINVTYIIPHVRV